VRPRIDLREETTMRIVKRGSGYYGYDGPGVGEVIDHRDDEGEVHRVRLVELVGYCGRWEDPKGNLYHPDAVFIADPAPGEPTAREVRLAAVDAARGKYGEGCHPAPIDVDEAVVEKLLADGWKAIASLSALAGVGWVGTNMGTAIYHSQCRGAYAAPPTVADCEAARP